MHPFMRKFRDSFAQTWLPRGINDLSQWGDGGTEKIANPDATPGARRELMLSTDDAPWIPITLLGPRLIVRARLRSLEPEAHAMSWQVKLLGEGLGHVIRLDGADLDRCLLNPKALDEVFEGVLLGGGRRASLSA